MENGKLNNFEYSWHLQRAAESKEKLRQMEEKIAENQAYLKELEEHKLRSVELNETIVKEFELTPMDIAKIEGMITEVEQSIDEYKKLRTSYSHIIEELEDLHSRYKKFLEEYEADGKHH